MSEKYYYIVKAGDGVEVVHPSQIREKDEILFQADTDEWNDFRLPLGAKFMDMTSDEVVEAWNNR